MKDGGPRSGRTTRRWRGCAELGLPVNEHIEELDDLGAVYEFCDRMLGQRHSLGYEIDGAVVKIDDLLQRRARIHEQGAALGDRLQIPARGEDHAPAQHHGEHRRTGRHSFAQLEPVFVGGSTVGLATLHNEDEVAQGRARG